MMALEPVEVDQDKPVVFLLQCFGNSTAGVGKCAQLLSERGYDPMVFHATGGGGKTMESLIIEGYCQGVLDITTHRMGG